VAVVVVRFVTRLMPNQLRRAIVGVEIVSTSARVLAR
jgi:hypothetical protein